MSDDMEDVSHGKTEEDARREAAAQVAPGSVGEVVQDFITCLQAGRLDLAVRYLAPELADFDLRTFHPAFLTEPGWGMSGQPRVIGLDTETVLLAKTGSHDGSAMVSEPTVLEDFQFTVRRSGERWLIAEIGPERDDPRAGTRGRR